MIKIYPFKNGQAYGWSFWKSLWDFFFPYAKNGDQEFIRAEAFTEWDSELGVVGRTFCTFRAFFFHYYYMVINSIVASIKTVLNLLKILALYPNYFAEYIEIVRAVILEPKSVFVPLFAGAIATDAFSTKQILTGGGSFSHTCTGSNLELVVCMSKSSTGDTVTGVTYNSVAMTQRVNAANTISNDGRIYIYELKNPSTGANTVAVSMSNGDGNHGSSGSYSGASGGFDNANSTNVTSSGNITVSVNVVANAWLISTHEASLANPGSNVNGTERTTLTDGDFADSNAALSAGSNSIGYNWAASDHVVIGAISISPTAPQNPITLDPNPIISRNNVLNTVPY